MLTVGPTEMLAPFMRSYSASIVAPGYATALHAFSIDLRLVSLGNSARMR